MTAIPFRSVVFDLDGTLIDSAPDIARAVNRTLAAYDRPALSVDQVRGMVGDGAGMLLRCAWQATGAPLAEERAADVLARFIELYAEDTADPSCFYPGVPATLAALAEAGVALGLCTNKPERVTRKLLAPLGLEATFAAVAGGDTLPFRKPDGRHLTWVIERTGGGAAAMVGDGINDVKAARAAGVPVVAVSFGYPRMAVAELGADVVIDRFDELPDALRKLA